MKKTGVLTYHYSNNYGGVLQSYALYKYLKSLKLDVEIINYIPSYVNLDNIFYESGLRKNIFKIKKEDMNPNKLLNRILIKKKYASKIVKKFDDFRNDNYKLSNRVDEKNIHLILKNYDAIIVGSDQIWSPGERNKKIYFLDYENYYKGSKISYAADSTIAEVNKKQINKLRDALEEFDAISVRNEHTQRFVKTLLHKNKQVVADPTLLWNFENCVESNNINFNKNEKYILVYVLGKEINGSNIKAIEKIKKIYGDIKVYSIVIPTRKFNKCNYADEIIYDLGPKEWINMFKNATFVYTDSYHGTLFSIKFRKPFLAYYTEKMRSTRFKDLGKRYKIDKFIVNNLDEIDEKESLNYTPNFDEINQVIEKHKETSKKFLCEALNIN